MFTKINNELHKILFTWHNNQIKKQEIKIKELELELIEKDKIISEKTSEIEDLKNKINCK